MLTEDLRRWFKEKWTAQDGSKCGDYKGRGRVKCRPSRRVSEKSPQTWGEMTKEEKKKAVRKKQVVRVSNLVLIKLAKPGTDQRTNTDRRRKKK